jgi:hypothetical protein
MRVLGEKEGLPPLPDETYFLWIRPDLINPLTRQVYDMLKTSLGLAQQGDAAAQPPRINSGRTDPAGLPDRA